MRARHDKYLSKGPVSGFWFTNADMSWMDLTKSPCQARWVVCPDPLLLLVPFAFVLPVFVCICVCVCVCTLIFFPFRLPFSPHPISICLRAQGASVILLSPLSASSQARQTPEGWPCCQRGLGAKGLQVSLGLACV